MSGKPYPEGVRKVLALLTVEAGLNAEIEQLRPQADRLHAAIAEVAGARDAISVLLASMDIEEKGNYGFEARTGRFLSEMYRAMKAELK